MGNNNMKAMKAVLTIAGSDSSGGAGIQADLKTMTMLGTFGMSAITAVTVQNTTGVKDVLALPCDIIRKQIEAVCEDIFPDAVKIGMLANEEIVHCVAGAVKDCKIKNVVLDPVILSTSNHRLLDTQAFDSLKTKLIPLADIITPNIPEASILSGVEIQSRGDMVKAAREISKWYHGAVLIKGGHLKDNDTAWIEEDKNQCMAADLLYENGKEQWLLEEFIDNPNTHGTGCTLSSAIACNLALGRNMYEAVSLAKQYLTGAIGACLDMGHGRGPLNHAYTLSDSRSV